MILSHTHRFIFIHVARTGGTSIEQTLSGMVGMNFERTHTNAEVLPDGNCKHLSAREMKRIVGDRIWDEYFTFAFVRNPYDRLLSGWSFEKALAGRVDWVDPEWTAFNRFEDFLDALAADREGRIRSHDSQLAMLGDARTDILVDFVGRFERLQEDFDSACRRIGLPPTRLSSTGRSPHRPWPEYYTQEREDAVKARFRDDFAAFGYSGDVPGVATARTPARVFRENAPAESLATSIRDCLEHLARDPDDLEALVGLGDAYSALGAFESAEAVLARARALASRPAALT